MPTRLFTIVPVILTILLVSTGRGQGRNPFVLGLGISPGLTSFTQRSSTETNFGLGAGFKIGHQINDRWQWYFSTLISPVGRKSFTTTSYGQVELTVRYFLRNEAPAYFVTAGGGFGAWDMPGWFAFDSGPGLHGGAGYEMSKHWNIEGTVSWISGNDYKVTSLWFILSYEI